MLETMERKQAEQEEREALLAADEKARAKATDEVLKEELKDMDPATIVKTSRAGDTSSHMRRKPRRSGGETAPRRLRKTSRAGDASLLIRRKSWTSLLMRRKSWTRRRSSRGRSRSGRSPKDDGRLDKELLGSRGASGGAAGRSQSREAERAGDAESGRGGAARRGGGGTVTRGGGGPEAARKAEEEEIRREEELTRERELESLRREVKEKKVACWVCGDTDEECAKDSTYCDRLEDFAYAVGTDGRLIGKTRNGQPPECWICMKKGHFQDKCPQSAAQDRGRGRSRSRGHESRGSHGGGSHGGGSRGGGSRGGGDVWNDPKVMKAMKVLKAAKAKQLKLQAHEIEQQWSPVGTESEYEEDEDLEDIGSELDLETSSTSKGELRSAMKKRRP